MLHLHPANPPPHYFAGLRRGLALAWPRHKGLPFVRDNYNGVVCTYEASLLVRTYATWNDAGFLLRRCVHSPGASAGCPGQHTYRSVPNPKKETLSKKMEEMGVLVGFWVLFFLEVDYFWDRGNRSRQNPTNTGSSRTPFSRTAAMWKTQ